MFIKWSHIKPLHLEFCPSHCDKLEKMLKYQKTVMCYNKMYIISIIHDLDSSFSWYSKFLQLCHSYCESQYKGQVPTWRSLLPTYQYIKNAYERRSQLLEKILGQWWFMEFKLSNGFMKKLSLITANAIFPIAIVS